MKKIAFAIAALIMVSCGSSSSSQSEATASETPKSPEEVPAMYVALSFDDGPNNTTTPEMLDVLESFDALPRSS